MVQARSSSNNNKKERIRRRAGDGILYKVSFTENAEPSLMLGNDYRGDEMFAAASTTSVVVDEQALQFSLNPFPTSVWSYTCFLGTVLVCWILYLLLPKAFRKQYFHASRRRYARNADKNMPAGGYWLPASKTIDGNASTIGSTTSTSLEREGMERRQQQQQQQQQQLHQRGGHQQQNQQSHSSPARRRMTSAANPPSPEHPALKKIPPSKIIEETMNRLQARGVRLIAHGVQCDPKRIWLKMDETTTTSTNQPNPAVTWQTEFPKRVPNQAGEVSIVLMRGTMHRIALKQVLYIDVGKKTNALMRPENRKVLEATCFSLLTQNGSLDLQTNSKLERDALVSCFSMILDNVHQAEDWRALYEKSPEPSLVSVSTAAEFEFGTEVRYPTGRLAEI
jgi:hypothetical protein